MFLSKVGTALVTLLQQADLLPKPAQKLAAITFLYDMYKATMQMREKKKKDSAIMAVANV